MSDINVLWAVVVAQLTEWLLTTEGDSSSRPVTGNPIKHEFRYGTGNIDEKALNGPFFKERFNNLLH